MIDFQLTALIMILYTPNYSLLNSHIPSISMHIYNLLTFVYFIVLVCGVDLTLNSFYFRVSVSSVV